MISPDAGNMGVKAIYVWAGLLVPTTIILYFFYPEVSHSHNNHCQQLLTCLQTYGRTYIELDELYARKIPAWRFKSTPTLSDQSGHKNKALISGQAARASVAQAH